ncbi:hypothetical protein Harman_21180 [Haloarcula mannanilytica]|uniref:Uncharacterized protein n=1 Tax=Haloarcula mannanilytica TaxID=2509225 RepID=A0A4C2ENL0_9EURY|nr:hypothetical protein Harman_21180 [Haloarcula mannanilytica]
MLAMGYTVEEPPDSSALVSLEPPLSVASVSVSSISVASVSVDAAVSVLPPEPPSESVSLLPLEQPAIAAILVAPVVAMNFRRDTKSDSPSGSCAITRVQQDG